MNRLMHKGNLLMVAATFSWTIAGVVVNAADEAVKDQPGVTVEKTDHARMKKDVVVRQLSKLDSGQVYGNNGEKVGHIKGIAIDANRGQIAYAVMEFDNFADFPNKQFAIPWRALDKKIDDKDASKITYAINVDREQLKTAKGFERDKWPDLAELKNQDAYGFWKVKPYWESHVVVRTEDSKIEVNATEEEKEKTRLQGTPISAENELIVRANDLVGHKIMDQDGKEFADLYDTMTDVHSGRLVYGIVQIDKAPDFSKDYLHAVPFELFRIEPTGKDQAGHIALDRGASKVVLKTSMDTIKNGPKFPEREWPNMTMSWGEEVYSHYGLQPYWKAHMRDDKARERKD